MQWPRWEQCHQSDAPISRRQSQHSSRPRGPRFLLRLHSRCGVHYRPLLRRDQLLIDSLQQTFPRNGLPKIALRETHELTARKRCDGLLDEHVHRRMRDFRTATAQLKCSLMVAGRRALLSTHRYGYGTGRTWRQCHRRRRSRRRRHLLLHRRRQHQMFACPLRGSST